MDIIELNKLTQKKKVSSAEDLLYEPKDINKDDALILVINACRKTYGLTKTVKIVHGLGVKKL